MGRRVGHRLDLIPTRRQGLVLTVVAAAPAAVRVSATVAMAAKEVIHVKMEMETMEMAFENAKRGDTSPPRVSG